MECFFKKLTTRQINQALFARCTAIQLGCHAHKSSNLQWVPGKQGYLFISALGKISCTQNMFSSLLLWHQKLHIRHMTFITLKHKWPKAALSKFPCLCFLKSHWAMKDCKHNHITTGYQCTSFCQTRVDSAM